VITGLAEAFDFLTNQPSCLIFEFRVQAMQSLGGMEVAMTWEPSVEQKY
jgi:hypothetical protein